MPTARHAGVLAALAAAPFALAYRFALVYRTRAGYPTPRPPQRTPADLGLPFEAVAAPADDGLVLPAWFVPANDGAPGPGVALVHGWESARDRLLPIVQFLHAAGFHCLAVDVRGHGANARESLPITAGEFGSDALAAWRALVARPEVTSGAILGHSMGAIGAILAAAEEARIAAVVATSAPADPWRLTRQTFRLARLPLPDVIAYPLAWLTTRVYLHPRGHRIVRISATEALARIDRPALLVHGTDDTVVPVSHLRRLAKIVTATGRPAETLEIDGGLHSWLYEFPVYRRTVAAFFARALDGPLAPDEAAARAEAVDARRPPPDAVRPPTQVELEPGGFRSLVGLASRLPGRPPEVQTVAPGLDDTELGSELAG
ncbi:MAG TPA: alpha/beta fold hydrolase [Candidatus Limnocylindrales bacterium]|nr:alpha/beta fold hydrolase [Candidatus Limnocylindrales bacterium]